METEILKTIGAIFGILIPVILFIVWHFRTVSSFEKQVNELKLQMKELENKDNLQQQTIDQLKELYPVLKTVIENLNKGKK